MANILYFLFQLNCISEKYWLVIRNACWLRVWQFYVCLFDCLFIPTLAAVFLIYCGYMIAVTLSSLMERNLLSVSVLLRSWHFNNLWMMQSLVIQKVILECRREQLAWWKCASYLTLQPTVLLIGSFFFLTVIVLLSICSQVNRVPAAFTHCEYRLQAHTMATVWLRGQRAGI